MVITSMVELGNMIVKSKSEIDFMSLASEIELPRNETGNFGISDSLMLNTSDDKFGLARVKIQFHTIHLLQNRKTTLSSAGAKVPRVH